MAPLHADSHEGTILAQTTALAGNLVRTVAIHLAGVRCPTVVALQAPSAIVSRPAKARGEDCNARHERSRP